MVDRGVEVPGWDRVVAAELDRTNADALALVDREDNIDGIRDPAHRKGLAVDLRKEVAARLGAPQKVVPGVLEDAGRQVHALGELEAFDDLPASQASQPGEGDRANPAVDFQRDLKPNLTGNRLDHPRLHAGDSGPREQAPQRVRQDLGVEGLAWLEVRDGQEPFPGDPGRSLEADLGDPDSLLGQGDRSRAEGAEQRDDRGVIPTGCYIAAHDSERRLAGPFPP